MSINEETGNVAGWQLNRALGALIGACIGDATGAPLERIHRMPSESDVRLAMQMHWSTQCRFGTGSLVTDDSEMTISLAHALADCCRLNENGAFQLERVAARYADWVRSGPPDMGLTVGSGIGVVRSKQSSFLQVCAAEGLALQMQRGAQFEAKMAAPSKSNGQLMRCSPLAIYGRDFSDEDLYALVKRDCSLSHIAPTCADASMVYCVALRELLRDQDCSGVKAFQVALDWARAHANEEVRDWMERIAVDDIPPAYPNAGFVKVALSIALSRLKALGTAAEVSASCFSDTISDVLKEGGDTDTNACIAGALVGALVGFNTLPAEWRVRLLTHQTTRPRFLHPSTMVDVAATLVEKAPKSFCEKDMGPLALEITTSREHSM